MNQLIKQKINEINCDQEHGAHWLSLQALFIFSLAIRESKTRSLTSFLGELSTLAKAIIKSRTNMVSIANYTYLLQDKIIRLSAETTKLDTVKKHSLQLTENVILSVRDINRKVTEKCAEKIVEKDSILTCSYSSTICQSLEFARKRIKEFHVIITESKFNNLAYGMITSEFLKKNEISVQLIQDYQMNKFIHQVTKVIVGSDTVLTDGSVINGIPSLELARAAAKNKIPFYCACETAKFDTRHLYNKEKTEAGFDLIPATLITGIITEIGEIRPADVDHVQFTIPFA